VVMVTVDCGPRLMAPKDCRSGTFRVGAIAKCGNGTDPASPVCWVGADGHSYDMAGNRSCAPVGSMNVCPQVPRFVDRGCGPGHDGPGGKAAPPKFYIGPAQPDGEYADKNGNGIILPHNAIPAPQPTGVQACLPSTQCTVAKFFDNIMQYMDFCPLDTCALISVAGGLAIAGYYGTVGDWKEAGKTLAFSLIGYGLGLRTGTVSKDYLRSVGAPAAKWPLAWYVNLETGAVLSFTSDQLNLDPEGGD